MAAAEVEGHGVIDGRAGKVVFGAAAIAEAVPEAGTRSVVATERTDPDGAFAIRSVAELFETPETVCLAKVEVNAMLAGASAAVCEADTPRLWPRVGSTEPNRP